MKGDVWILPPVEYYPGGGVVGKLKHAVSGLKNVPKLWQQHLTATLESHGFKRMTSDPNLYYNANAGGWVLRM